MAATTATDTAAPPRGRVGVRSDHDLVAAVRAGDDYAFEQLYERYNRRVAYYVYGMVHDYGRAEDIAQEVFMSALRRMRQTERPIAFKPWIYEIAKNACIDQFRRSQRTNEVSYEAENALGVAADLTRMAHSGSTPENVVEQKISLDNLCGAFSGLSETHHQILVMRELEGLSYSEIGERLNMSRPAVESTLFRARRRLAEEYEELVTGERCLRVQAIVDGALESVLGARDRRRMAAHVSHCQACRRHAFEAGIDLGEGGHTIRSKVAALLPFPMLLRRRAGVGEVAGSGPGTTHATTLAQWSSQLSTAVDPSTVGWVRAAAAAATVAVAGVGAGTQEAHLANALMRHHSAPARVALSVPVPAAAPLVVRGHVVRHVEASASHQLRAPAGRSRHRRPEPVAVSASHPSSPAAITAVPASKPDAATEIVARIPVSSPVTVPVDLDHVKSGPVRRTVHAATQAVRRQTTAATEQGQRLVDRIVDVLKG